MAFPPSSFRPHRVKRRDIYEWYGDNAVTGEVLRGPKGKWRFFRSLEAAQAACDAANKTAK